ncbi:hypothetical protein R6Q57_010216 [Mikania cordata]
MNNHRTIFVKTFQIVEEQVSSPLSAQLLEFCGPDLFRENSEVASSSNCCHEEQSSCVMVNPSIPPFVTKCPTLMNNVVSACTTVTATTNNDLSLMFEHQITPLDLTNTSHFDNQYPFGNQDQFDISLLQNEDNIIDSMFSYPHTPSNDHVAPHIEPTTLLHLCEEDIISPIMPSKFILSNNKLSSNYHFINTSINSNLPMSTECENLFFENDIQFYKLEFHGDNNGIFCPDHSPHSFNSNDFQAYSNESQHLVNGCGSSTIPLASGITILESESLRVTNKLSSEERRVKINKYMKKRNERNFNKKIKYACRKTLADSRPRVRGRFAKHDEFGENNKTNNNHEEDTDEDERTFHEVVKEEKDDNFESSDILAHISGVNSLKCNYSIQSWI